MCHSEEFVFSFKSKDALYYGCCRRFRDLRDLPDRRIDSNGDVTLVCLCIVTSRSVRACDVSHMVAYGCAVAAALSSHAAAVRQPT